MISLTYIKTVYQKKQALLRDMSYIYLSGAFMGLSGFLIVIILANHLSQNEYGNYKYILSIVGILSALTLTGGFRNTIIQSVAQGFDGIVRHLYKANIRLSLPMLCASIFVGGYYILHQNTLLGYAIIIATSCAIFANNGVIAYAYLNGRKNYTGLFWVQSVQSVIILCAIYFATVFTTDFLTILITSVLTPAITLTVILMVIKYKVLRNDTLNDKIVQYGKQLSLLGVLTTIMMHIDSILIFKIIGSQGLALYAIATPFVDRIMGFLKATYFFALPKFTEMGTKKAFIRLYQRSFVALCLGIVIYIVYYLCAPIIFELFFPQYIQSISLTRLFAINIPIVALSILPEAFLDSIVEIRNKYIVKSIVFTSRLISLCVFIVPFGIIGVVWSEIITRTIGLLAVLVLIHMHTDAPLSKPVDIKSPH